MWSFYFLLEIDSQSFRRHATVRIKQLRPNTLCFKTFQALYIGYEYVGHHVGHLVGHLVHLDVGHHVTSISAAMSASISATTLSATTMSSRHFVRAQRR